MATVAQKSFVGQPQARVCRAVPVKALPQHAEKAQLAAASAAVAIMLSASPALAGVIFENQPKVKQAFQNQPAEVVKKTASAPAAPGQKAAAKSTESESSSGGFAVQSLWPLGVVASGGALFGIAKVDNGMDDLLSNVAVKDCNSFGIGTEDKIRGKGGYQYVDEKAAAVGTVKKSIKKALKKK